MVARPLILEQPELEALADRLSYADFQMPILPTSAKPVSG
jgi:hypothetical protein